MQRKKVAMGILVVGLVTVIVLSWSVSAQLQFNAPNSTKAVTYLYMHEVIAATTPSGVCTSTQASITQNCDNYCRSQFANQEAHTFKEGCQLGCMYYRNELLTRCNGQFLHVY